MDLCPFQQKNENTLFAVRSFFHKVRFPCVKKAWFSKFLEASPPGPHFPLLAVTIPAGVAPGIFQRGADSSDDGAKIWFSGYYECQKSPNTSFFTFRRGACSDGDYSPIVLPWRHPCIPVNVPYYLLRLRFCKTVFKDRIFFKSLILPLKIPCCVHRGHESLSHGDNQYLESFRLICIAHSIV